MITSLNLFKQFQAIIPCLEASIVEYDQFRASLANRTCCWSGCSVIRNYFHRRNIQRLWDSLLVLKNKMRVHLESLRTYEDFSIPYAQRKLFEMNDQLSLHRSGLVIYGFRSSLG